MCKSKAANKQKQVSNHTPPREKHPKVTCRVGQNPMLRKDQSQDYKDKINLTKKA